MPLPLASATFQTVAQLLNLEISTILSVRPMTVTQTFVLLFSVLSVFYVFYEQYLTIVVDSVKNISFCLLAILLITFILLGFDLYSAAVVVITIVMIIVDIMGMMFLWNIDLNALSLVNLIMVNQLV